MLRYPLLPQGCWKALQSMPLLFLLRYPPSYPAGLLEGTAGKGSAGLPGRGAPGEERGCGHPRTGVGREGEGGHWLGGHWGVKPLVREREDAFVYLQMGDVLAWP